MVQVVVLLSREVWCPAWVFARCSGLQWFCRLTAVVGPSGTGTMWSWSHRWAGVVQIGLVQVPSRKSMALPSLRDGNLHRRLRRSRQAQLSTEIASDRFCQTRSIGDVEQVAFVVGE